MPVASMSVGGAFATSTTCSASIGGKLVEAACSTAG